MPARAKKRKNLFGWGKATSPRMTTAARGGIAEHIGRGRKTSGGNGTAKLGGIYKGYGLKRTSDGEWYSTLDPSSWFDTKAQVQKHIDWYLKSRGNPSRKKSRAEKLLEEVPPIRLAKFTKKQLDAAKREYLKRHGNPSKFDRCVKDVKAKGGAANAYAVCTAAGTRNPRYSATPDNPVCRRGKRVSAGARKSLMFSAKDDDAARRKAQSLANRTGTGWELERFDKRNPAGAAVEAFEEFHGHAPDETVVVKKRIHVHEHLAGAGALKRLVVKGVDGKRHSIVGFRGALLAFSEEGSQLFVEGGDQSINLEDFGIKDPHEIETLGKVVHIDYFTRKDHLGDEGGEAVYTHQFTTTNERGKHARVRIARYPDLIYRVRDQSLEFSGGSYEVRAEGIDK